MSALPDALGGDLHRGGHRRRGVASGDSRCPREIRICQRIHTRGHPHLADDLSDDDEGGLSEHPECRAKAQGGIHHLHCELAGKARSAPDWQVLKSM